MYKKLTAALLTLLLILSVSIAAFAEEEQSFEGYIQIKDRAGLESMANEPDKSYVLMADIDMGEKDWVPIAFAGTLNGNGHTLYNLKIRQTGADAGTTVDGNRKQYETYFAALFSKLTNANISNLNILNADIRAKEERNSFAAILAGYMENTEILDCNLSGRVYLEMSDKMCGTGGVIGFGDGKISNCKTDVTLVLVDTNTEIKCEQFLGAIMATGYADIENCEIKLQGYASVHGYVHNGGIAGMYYVHGEDTRRPGYVKGCSVDATINFFEDNTDRRAYCEAYVGEPLHRNLSIKDNTTVNFTSNEVKEYDKPLLPETCENPEYEQEEYKPDCENFGYTSYKCKTCGYEYKDNYKAPAHEPGAWQEIKEPTYEEAGKSGRFCTICNKLIEEDELPMLIAVSSCLIKQGKNIEIEYKKQSALTAEVKPDNSTNTELTWQSSDEKVAAVDKDGVITATGRGEAKITCASKDGFANSEITVRVYYTWWQWIVKILLFGWIWY
ncbi:MAG: hypothetical protein GX684_00430 [Ruminococcaceae bacterium]|nr:hypothetical protein [Oscillospiraceae bacterium]